ncbi:sugar ABC transporter substrate-binding protein [Oceanobacillus polygoni]|uniref:Ribose transport system substrate-binding protein n=1 Tax=Oceanobacillus polygoni TaxID=1235259 RepID=A0A9X0YNF1_9BACI|nr:sugar ABC transporter substrate-binding protein [Oceanobacillus polygoni]MBP2076005.1 ribose transport system substrate-binding protein [Oceanobacillus polygoni]
MRNYMKYLAFFTVILLLVACSEANSSGGDNSADSIGEENDSYKFATVLMTLSSEYWQMHKAGAEDAAKEFGISLDVLGPADETQFEEQVKIVEDQIASGADALIIAPSLPEAMLPILNQADNENIPVVLADADVEEFEDKVTFIGTENYDAGKLAGEYISEQLEDGDKVAIIRGQLGAKVHDERTNGFQDALKDKNIEFIVQDAQSDRVKAVNIMENVLTSNSDVKVVFATSDEMALGAYQGLENNNRSDLPLIGFDGTPDGLQAVQDGKIIADIAQDPYQMGYMAIEAAYKALQGEEVEKRIDSGVNVITNENVEEEIEKINGYLGD